MKHFKMWEVVKQNIKIYELCCSVAKSWLTLCDPMDCSTPGFPVLYRVCSNSCPLSQWCHPTISSSVIPLSSCSLSFPASGSFLVCWLFASNGQSTGASASAWALPRSIQSWFPLGLTGWILLLKRLSRVMNSNGLQNSRLLQKLVKIQVKVALEVTDPHMLL